MYTSRQTVVYISMCAFVSSFAYSETIASIVCNQYFITRDECCTLLNRLH